MRLLYVVEIEEKQTRFLWFSISNRPLAAICAAIQLIVAMASLFQHLLSIYLHRHVFLCRSNIGRDAPWQVEILAYDIIIFDFGLMHRILGTEECVANYLDGGYMRFAWCVEHGCALLMVIGALIFHKYPLWVFWPGLLMQSSYSLGLSVLSMATAPKLLEALGGKVDGRLAAQFAIYIFGFTFNWLFTFILWHYYWYMEKLLNPQRPVQRRNPRPIYV